MKNLIVLLLVFFFLLGFHNLDSCHNYKIINLELKNEGIEFKENGLLFKEVNVEQCYMIGLGLMVASFTILAFLSMKIEKKSVKKTI